MSSRAKAARSAALVALAALTGIALADLPRAQTAGTLLPEAPSLAPGRVSAEPTGALRVARERSLDGDHAGAVNALAPWLGGKRRITAAGDLA